MSHSPKDRLKQLLSGMSPERVWRPVAGPDGEILSPGHGVDEDGPDALPESVDFTGQTVIDLGCNFGEAVFFALSRGAVRADGVDSDELAVEGARILAEWRGVENASFHAADFLTEPLALTADAVLLIDFIGKGVVVKKRLDAVLSVAATAAKKRIVATIRPIYAVAELPGTDEADLRAAYGQAFTRDGRFHLFEYMRRFYERDWSAEVLSGEAAMGKKYKYAVRFKRRT